MVFLLSVYGELAGVAVADETYAWKASGTQY